MTPHQQAQIAAAKAAHYATARELQANGMALAASDEAILATADEIRQRQRRDRALAAMRGAGE